MEQPKNEVLSGNTLESFFNDSYVEPTPQEEPTPEITEFFNDGITEEVKPTETTPKTELPKTEQISFYDSLIVEMINDGDWVDGEIELEDGSVVMLSEMKNVSPDLFKQIKNSQKALQDEDFKSKYISVEGLDDTTKKMIELKKAGGDITSLIKADAQFVHPLKNFDLDNDDVQAYLVAQKYSSMGIDQDIIQMKIEKLKKDSQLDLEAKKIIDEVNSNFDAHIEEEKTKQLELNKKIEEEQKSFKKSVSESFKNFGLEKESLVRNLIDKTTKFDENGLTEVDKLFFESKKNPDLHSKIASLLIDEESFNKIYTHKAKIETKKAETVKLLKVNTKSSSTAVTKQNPIEEFFNQ